MKRTRVLIDDELIQDEAIEESVNCAMQNRSVKTLEQGGSLDLQNSPSNSTPSKSKLSYRWGDSFRVLTNSFVISTHDDNVKAMDESSLKVNRGWKGSTNFHQEMSLSFILSSAYVFVGQRCSTNCQTGWGPITQEFPVGLSSLLFWHWCDRRYDQMREFKVEDKKTAPTKGRLN